MMFLNIFNGSLLLKFVQHLNLSSKHELYENLILMNFSKTMNCIVEFEILKNNTINIGLNIQIFK